MHATRVTISTIAHILIPVVFGSAAETGVVAVPESGNGLIVFAEDTVLVFDTHSPVHFAVSSAEALVTTRRIRTTMKNKTPKVLALIFAFASLE